MIERAPLPLLIAMASAAIYGRDLALMVSSRKSLLILAPDGSASVFDDPPDPDFEGLIPVTAMRPGTALPVPLAVQPRPNSVPPDLLARLSSYAERTLVPATEASRTRGAGSNRSDND